MAHSFLMGISGTGIRVVRAAVFTALCVALSTGTHVLLSGVPLPLPSVVAVFSAVFAIAYLLAGQERRFPHIAAVLLPLQVAADTLFTTGQAACFGERGPVAASRFSGMDLFCVGGDFGTPLARLVAGGESTAAAGADTGAGWLLLGTQLLIGLFAACWLRRGEAAVARLLRAAAATFRPLLIAVRASARPAADTCHPAHGTTRGPAPAAPALPLLTHSVVRRGPPCLVLSA